MEVKGLIQGSNTWKLWRQSHLGASDAPIIMNVGFKTPLRLWQEKMGVEIPYVNDAMRRGTLLEPVALAEFNKLMGEEFSPAVFVSDEYHWMSASLDGMNFEGTEAVEIKLAGSKDHATALKGFVPEKYMPQLQHQMFVCNLPEIYYYSFDGTAGVLLVIPRDEEFISELISKEADFYRRMVEFDAPPENYEDWIVSNDNQLQYHLSEYDNWKIAFDDAKENMEKHKQWIVDFASGNNLKCKGMKVQKIVSQGRVDYDAIEVLQSIDLTAYRKKPTESWRIIKDNGK